MAGRLPVFAGLAATGCIRSTGEGRSAWANGVNSYFAATADEGRGRRDRSMTARKRVIIWGTGYYGREGLRCAIEHRELELVGVHAHSPDKDGVDAGALCGLGPMGLRATADVAALLALRADCLIYYATVGNRD